MQKILLLTLISTFALAGNAAVVKLRDHEQNCTIYKVVPKDADGNLHIAQGEVIINQKDAYGLSFTDMEIDFANREVRVQPQINVILGMNKPLLNTKSVISADNPQFNFLINQLNRKLFLFEQICISDKNEIEYAKMFETPSTNEQKIK